MSSHPTRRRWLLGGGLFTCLLLVVAGLFRFSLMGFAIGGLLKRAGASDITYQVTRVSPWRVVVEDVGFLLRTRNYAAKRVSIDRRHWWSASLGQVKVEQGQVPLVVADWQSTPEGSPGSGEAPKPTTSLPMEELSFDGRLVVQAAGQPDQVLNLDFKFNQGEATRWSGQITVSGPGLRATASGHYDLVQSSGDFAVPALTLDVQRWRGFVAQMITLPDLIGGWEIEGQVSALGTGRFTADTWSAQGEVHLREGRVNDPARKITAQGVEVDLTVSDFGNLTAKPGMIRISELNTSAFPMKNLRADFSLAGPDRVEFSMVTLSALGGTLAAEPFVLNPSRDDLSAVLLVDNVSVAELLALTKDLPATAVGRVNGRFPINLDANGLQLGTGWLALKSGVNAEIAFNAKGLLTGGVAPQSPRFAVLQKIESGLLKLGISELRLDIRPPDAPPGRSATLHIKGAPLDPEVKAPVILDLNVNGPLEKLLNLGFDSRLSMGSKP